MFLRCNWQLKKILQITFLRCNWQLKKLISCSILLSANAKCLMGMFVRILREKEFWSLKCKALNKNGNIQKKNDHNNKQVGFFKKNPMKRSAAVYLLCVCLSFPVSRK